MRAELDRMVSPSEGDGKEGVAGSSPAEGLKKTPAKTGVPTSEQQYVPGALEKALFPLAF